MKFVIIAIGFLLFKTYIPNQSNCAINEQGVSAIFDAYEGDMYFFTDIKTNEPLTLRVKTKVLVDTIRLPEEDEIGEKFKISIEKEGRLFYIQSLEKL